MEQQVARFRADLEALTGAAPARVAVAVSGGPDSLALLVLADSAFPGKVQAATVDHGLRPESGVEAAYVAGICGAMSVPHATLRAGMTDTANIQAAARARRYALLARWLDETDAPFVATAHHLDDQAETLVMRLMRGSGLSGLSGIRAVNAPILRPLLGWRRDELAAVVRAAGLSPVDDPSNADPRFDRVVVRRHLAEADWLNPPRLARSASALADAEEAMQWTVDRLREDRLVQGPRGVSLDPAHLPVELRRRLVLSALSDLDCAAPRGDDVMRLIAILDGGGTATLAGIKCVGGAEWRFSPAPPRR